MYREETEAVVEGRYVYTSGGAGSSIQHGLTSSQILRDSSSISFSFSKLMLEGKVYATLLLLTDCDDSAPLQLDKMIRSKSVRDICWSSGSPSM